MVSRRELDYLRAVEECCRVSGEARLKEVSRALRVKPPSALEALRRLIVKGLVARTATGGYVLTERGLEVLEVAVRRHRILETFLVVYAGLSAEEACAYAARFDVYVPDELVDHLCKLMGHPRTCPHGRLIPSGRCHDD